MDDLISEFLGVCQNHFGSQEETRAFIEDLEATLSESGEINFDEFLLAILKATR